jgi:hypothetical protein
MHVIAINGVVRVNILLPIFVCKDTKLYLLMSYILGFN